MAGGKSIQNKTDDAEQRKYRTEVYVRDVSANLHRSDELVKV